MSVQIRVSPGSGSGRATFDSPTGVQQSDLVFWFNGDTETHYPVPRCGSLKVAPGASTPPFQPVPDDPIAVGATKTVKYGCAMPNHEAEQGTVVVNADPVSPGAGAAGANPQSVQIAIGAGGTFPSVDVAQIDTVVWRNDDSQTHWPVPNCSGLKVDPGKSSNGVQLVTSTAAPTLPMAISYGCAIAGHENESGMINVYDNLAPVSGVAIPQTTPFTQVVVVTGGKSPYTIQQDAKHPEITLEEAIPAGSSGGVAAIMNQAATQTGAITLQVNVTDGLGRTFNQPIQVTV